ncbi:MAG: NAD-dependent epimerase/dehydratase family protein [Clostridiales bacterium]|nr:NAD-dependent epimerase/dehydratase family protein [Clostridiales bacterium]
MQRINVVTGATGHIGVALIRELHERGEYVRALVRRGNSYDFLEPYIDEVAYGDVTEPESLAAAFLDADIVYHLAGIISIGKGDGANIDKVNIGGTQNVIAAAKSAGVKRLIYTSSVHALHYENADEIIREKPYFSPEKLHDAYSVGKAVSSNLILNEVKKGELDAVILMPSGVVGPYAYRRSNIGQMIIEYVNKRLIAYIKGEYDFVDVRDVASALYAASDTERVKSGETFLLSGNKVTVKEMLKMLERATAVPAPRIKLPLFLAYVFVPLMERLYTLRKMKPLYTSMSIKVLNSNGNFDNTKAREILGYSPRSAEESLREEYEFMKEEGMLSKE